MNRIEMNEAFLATYRLALDKEDDFEAVMALFQKYPDLLYGVLYRWFEFELKSFIYLRAGNMPFLFGEKLIMLGRLTPNLFADLVRRTFAPPEAPLQEGDEGYVKELSDEEEITLQQEWLKKNLPEIAEDIQAESASSESYINSEAGKKSVKVFVNRFVTLLNNMPDPEKP
jgi:hypothetical protein